MNVPGAGGVTWTGLSKPKRKARSESESVQRQLTENVGLSQLVPSGGVGGRAVRP